MQRAQPISSAVRFRVEPRDVPAAKAARRLHLTHAQFVEALDRLQARGFPSADPVTGHYDMKAIDAWMDRRSGLATEMNPIDAANDFHARLDALRARHRKS